MSDEDDKTVFRPPSGGSAAPPPPSDATIIAVPGRAAAAPPPVRPAAGVQVGDVLNHIFEVKRFIARGGMGEVFEGINVNSDERVAIKVILPALAADPNVTAMFRKEAQTLVRLSHPALVQYRVLAQEPQIGVFYIVTEYIDGVNLSDVLGKISPTADELIGLTRRLAEGLRAAHMLGAIHRDISPDNVLLENGKLERARIIDFGIAKDVDPGSKTIIGDGFAGKLGYVAPEQLGDFGRNVGTWTDVYSLGLVILAVAAGRGADIGGSFVEAIDKRRKGIDTEAAPATLRPILDRMLAADPTQRLQSMDAVIEALSAPPPPPRTEPKRPRRKPAETAAAKPPREGPSATERLAALPRPALIGGGAAAGLALLGLMGWLAFGGQSSAPPPPAPRADAGAPTRAVSADAVRGAVQAALPAVPCTWLNLLKADGGARGIDLAFSGVAGHPAEAESAVFKAVQGTGAAIASSDFSGVAPVDASFCAALDAVRPIRADGPQRLSVSQPKYEIAPFTEGDNKGKLGARVIINLNLEDLPSDFALYSIEENGLVSEILPSRAAFLSAARTNGAIETLPGRDRYRVSLDGERSAGWSGILLLTGKGGFDASQLPNMRSPDWHTRFADAAAKNGWKAEMVWFKFVDELPN